MAAVAARRVEGLAPVGGSGGGGEPEPAERQQPGLHPPDQPGGRGGVPDLGRGVVDRRGGRHVHASLHQPSGEPVQEGPAVGEPGRRAGVRAAGHAQPAERQLVAVDRRVQAADQGGDRLGVAQLRHRTVLPQRAGRRRRVGVQGGGEAGAGHRHRPPQQRGKTGRGQGLGPVATGDPTLLLGQSRARGPASGSPSHSPRSHPWGGPSGRVRPGLQPVPGGSAAPAPAGPGPATSAGSVASAARRRRRPAPAPLPPPRRCRPPTDAGSGWGWPSRPEAWTAARGRPGR